MDNEIFTQCIDGIPCKTQEPFDFSFLKDYGSVFKAFDEQGSGCVCFGVSDGVSRYFIKFAGVKTFKYQSRFPVCDAIDRLRAAVPKYVDLAHPLLIRFIEAKEAGGGFMTVFEWFDGVSFGIETPITHEKYLALPLDKKISIYESILRFHAHVAERGYVAMDFNDYSALYNFETGEMKICDIDFYAKQSYINGIGEALGDRMLFSPEEQRSAGLLDEVTNVYTMGAAAFMLFSEYDRSPGVWPLNPESYAVVKKATNDAKADRQQSIARLIKEWSDANEKMGGRGLGV